MVVVKLVVEDEEDHQKIRTTIMILIQGRIHLDLDQVPGVRKINYKGGRQLD